MCRAGTAATTQECSWDSEGNPIKVNLDNSDGEFNQGVGKEVWLNNVNEPGEDDHNPLNVVDKEANEELADEPKRDSDSEEEDCSEESKAKEVEPTKGFELEKEKPEEEETTREPTISLII